MLYLTITQFYLQIIFFLFIVIKVIQFFNLYKTKSRKLTSFKKQAFLVESILFKNLCFLFYFPAVYFSFYLSHSLVRQSFFLAGGGVRFPSVSKGLALRSCRIRHNGVPPHPALLRLLQRSCHRRAMEKGQKNVTSMTCKGNRSSV